MNGIPSTDFQGGILTGNFVETLATVLAAFEVPRTVTYDSQ